MENGCRVPPPPFISQDGCFRIWVMIHFIGHEINLVDQDEHLKKKKKKLNWIKKKKRVLHVARTQKHDAIVCVWWWEMLFLHRFWWKCLKYNTLNRKRSWLPASTNIYLPFPVTPHLFYLWGIHPKYQAPTKVDICSLPSQPPGGGELQNLCAGILLDVVKSKKSWI